MSDAAILPSRSVGRLIAIFRTNADTLPAVVTHCKHALSVSTRLRAGDTILISQTVATLGDGEKPIKYVMTFRRARRDLDGETLRLFGKRWRFVIDGENCTELRTPFQMSDLPNPRNEYAQGGPVMYVHSDDARELVQRGFLQTVDTPL